MQQRRNDDARRAAQEPANQCGHHDWSCRRAVGRSATTLTAALPTTRNRIWIVHVDLPYELQTI